MSESHKTTYMSPSTQNESFQHQKWEFRTANQQLVKALLALTYGPRWKKTSVIRVSTTNNKDADQSAWICRLVCCTILSAFVVCCKCLLTLFNKVKYRDKQCGPRSDCSYRSSLIGVYTVCWKGFWTFQQTTKADEFCCDWRFKGCSQQDSYIAIKWEY